AHVFGKSIMMVTTGSMEPSIHEGDYILIEKTAPELLDEGDIITFFSEDKAIYGMPNTHRILEKSDDGGFITKGDANPVPDSYKVYPEKIIGVYVRKIRFLRWINSFKSAKKLVLFLVFAAALAMSFYEIRTIGKIAKDSSENRKKRIEDEKEKLIREAIDKEKQKLYEENFSIQTKNDRGDDEK
ncbi:MAG: signal peptidase I, partial [Ruminococcus sp.]